MIRQFVYNLRIARISLFSRKNTKCGSIVFLSKKGYQKPNFQNNSFYILCIEFIMGYKNGPKIFGGVAPKAPRRLGLYNNIISSEVIIWIKHN